MKKLFLFTLLSILAFSFIMSCEAEKKEPVSENMSQQISMLPGDAEAIAYFNFDRIKESAFYTMLMDSAEDLPFHDEEYREFVEQTGLDIQKDIHEIYLTSGANKRDDPTENVFVLIKGEFDPERLITFLKENDEKDKIDTMKFGNYTFYTERDAKKSFCFYDNSTMIAGSPEMMEEWINNQSGTTSAVSQELLARINDLKFKNSAWFTVNANQFVSNLRDDEVQKLRGIEDLKTMSVSMDFSDQFQFDGNSEFTNAETAELFKEALKGFIATGKLSVSKDREVIDILNSINIDSKDNHVKIDFKLTRDEIQKLMDQRNFLPAKII